MWSNIQQEIQLAANKLLEGLARNWKTVGYQKKY